MSRSKAFQRIDSVSLRPGSEPEEGKACSLRCGEAVAWGPEGIVFDMDGVLVDSEPLHVEAFESVFREIGIGSDHGIRFEEYLGGTDVAVWKDVVARYSLPYSLEELVARKRARLIQLLRRHRPFYPWIPGLIRILARRFPLAIASGSAQEIIHEVLRLGGVEGLFQVVVSSEEVSRPKPAPDTYLEAVHRLGLSPHCCLAVEDTQAGVQAAKTAGLRVLAIAHTVGVELLRQADWVVEDGRQLLWAFGIKERDLEEIGLPEPSPEVEWRGE